MLGRGKRIQPSEVGLFVAVNGEVKPMLEEIAATLRKHHNLKIGLVQIRNGKVLL